MEAGRPVRRPQQQPASPPTNLPQPIPPPRTRDTGYVHCSSQRIAGVSPLPGTLLSLTHLGLNTCSKRLLP